LVDPSTDSGRYRSLSPPVSWRLAVLIAKSPCYFRLYSVGASYAGGRNRCYYLPDAKESGRCLDVRSRRGLEGPRMQFPSEPAHESWVGGRSPAPQGDASGVPLPWEGRWERRGTTLHTGGLQPPAGRSKTWAHSTTWPPVLSCAVSLALYMFVFGWELGLGLTLLLLVHELGHFALIRAKGLPAALPVFIPFIGAYVAMSRLPPSVRDEAEIALAGPLAGCLSALACLGLYEATTIHLFLWLAYWGYLLNLLNLLPLWPLDGGRITGALSRWFWLLVFSAATGYALVAENGLLLLGTAFAAFLAAQYARRKRWRSPYYQISRLGSDLRATVGPVPPGAPSVGG